MSQTQQNPQNNVYNCSNVIFHALDTIVGVLIVVDSILLLTVVNSFVGFFLPVYFLVFGLIIVVFVFYAPPPLYFSLYFYNFFIGRGLTFLFIGTVILTFGDDFSVATGVITILISFVYLILSIWTKFCNLACNLPPPLVQRQTGVIPPKGSTINYPPTNNNPSNSNQINPNQPKARDLDSEMAAAFGKDLNSMDKQKVNGYDAEIPIVLVMLEEKLFDTGGYKKKGIFDPKIIAWKMENDSDESYSVSNNIILFFSEMPSPLLSFVDKKVFEKGVSADAMWRVLEEIDIEHAAVTQFLWDILAKVAKFESDTDMNSEQLGAIFGPLMTMRKEDINNDVVTASKMSVCWRRGIEWRMGKL